MLKGYDLTLIERALSLAISEAPQEPVPYYLLGVTYSLENKMIMAEKHYDQSLRLNPEFEPPINALLVTKCRNKIVNLFTYY
jgi:tetratricopeptide (TPR) repeat protein